MAKIYRVIQIKLNEFKKMSMWSLTISKALSQWQTFLKFYLQDGGKNQQT